MNLTKLPEDLYNTIYEMVKKEDPLVALLHFKYTSGTVITDEQRYNSMYMLTHKQGLDYNQVVKYTEVPVLYKLVRHDVKHVLPIIHAIRANKDLAISRGRYDISIMDALKEDDIFTYLARESEFNKSMIAPSKHFLIAVYEYMLTGYSSYIGNVYYIPIESPTPYRVKLWIHVYMSDGYRAETLIENIYNMNQYNTVQYMMDAYPEKRRSFERRLSRYIKN